MDLLFKMVRGKTNLFLIARQDENLKRIYTLYYVYTIYRLIFIIGIKVQVYAFLNLETYVIYIRIFKLIFKVLGNTTRLSIQFAHIYGTGLRTAIVNIYKK